MKNYREAWQRAVYERLEQYSYTGLPYGVNTPQRYTYYQAVRTICTIRSKPRRIFKQGGNSSMDELTFNELIAMLDEILPNKENI